MFDKFLKVTVLKKNQEKNNKNEHNPQLDKLLNKFDHLEKELILKGVPASHSNYITHPLKKIEVSELTVKSKLAKDILRRRDDDIEILAKSINKLINSFDLYLDRQKSIFLNSFAKQSSDICVVKFELDTLCKKTDLEIIEIFQKWRKDTDNISAQISIERTLDDLNVCVVGIVSRKRCAILGSKE